MNDPADRIASLCRAVRDVIAPHVWVETLEYRDAREDLTAACRNERDEGETSMTRNEMAEFLRGHCARFSDRNYMLFSGESGPECDTNEQPGAAVWLTERTDGGVDVTLTTLHDVSGPVQVAAHWDMCTFEARVDVAIDELRSARDALQATEHAAMVDESVR